MQCIAPHVTITGRNTDLIVDIVLVSIKGHCIFCAILIFYKRFVSKYLLRIVRSLRYMVVSGWMEEGRRPWDRLRLLCGSWEVDKEARTLAAAEAAVLEGTKRWSRPCSPDAVRIGWARTLAKRFSGWKSQ